MNLKTDAVRPFNAERVRPPRGFEPPGLAPGMPVDLEIGCGSGWHSIRYARANPGRLLIALERTRTRFALFERRLARHREQGLSLGNLMAVHADAVPWITHALGPESVDRVFLLYPNPYPKNSDRGKRWHAMPFMHRLLDVLKPGGEIRIATNERFYLDEAGRFMRGIWGLEEAGALQIASGMPGIPRTHFEKKYLARGEICRQRCWRKAVFNTG